MVKERYIAKSDTPVHELYGRSQPLMKELHSDVKKIVKRLVKDMQLNPKAAKGYYNNYNHLVPAVSTQLTQIECESEVNLLFDKDNKLYMRLIFNVEDNATYSDALIFHSCCARIDTIDNGKVISLGAIHHIHTPLTYEHICDQLVSLPYIKQLLPYAIED